MKRNVYLSMVPPDKAVEAIKSTLRREKMVRPETVASQDACGRVSASACTARCSSPTYHAAAMDGIAVRSMDTFAAREGEPLELTLNESYVPVNTGNPLPGGRDAVIMIEHLEQVDENTLRIEAPAFPWQHVRRIGEDIVASELLFPQNHEFSPYDVGALLSAGIWEMDVWEKVRVAFIPTGDEVLPFADKPDPVPGQVIESNSQVYRHLTEKNHAEFTLLPVCKDDEKSLTRAVQSALDAGHQVVIVGAGSSAGSRDYTRTVFEKLGEVIVHGISIMPGKPTLAAMTKERPAGRLLIGAPGYPVSAVVAFEEVLAPVLAWMGRRRAPERVAETVRLAKDLPSKPGMAEMVRLAVGRVGNVNVAAPLARGAGVITSMTKAQAVTRLPAASEGLAEGAELQAELMVPSSALGDVLVHVGSHDNTLDLLADSLMGLEQPFRLVSSHVGSMGGLAALKSGSALLAGVHLFDPESGDFNFPFIQRHLQGIKVEVINLAIRHQGLIVAPNNPKSIASVQDLGREDVSFINRQRGAGTRILLDHHLKTAGISPRDVEGYDREEFTHMAVAVNILTGAADCGLGIFAAAKALGLGFVPLARERYDLLIPSEYMQEPRIQALLELIGSDELRTAIEALGGYETPLTGKVMTPGIGLGQSN